MVWYQYKNEPPTNGLPHRLRTEDGSTRTCLCECSEEELTSMGFVVVSDPPNYNSNTQEIVYDNQTSTWSVETTTDVVKVEAAWEQNEMFRDKLKINLLNSALKYSRSGGTISTHFDGAISILDNMTRDNHSSPFEFDWRYPSSVGYTSEVVAGITSTEHRMINSAFVDFIDETYIPNQKY